MTKFDDTVTIPALKISGIISAGVIGTDSSGNVQAGSSSSAGMAANVQTGTAYTLALADNGLVVATTNSGAVTLTIPPHSSIALPYATSSAQGAVISLLQHGTGQFTVAPGAGVTVHSASSLTARAQYSLLGLWQYAQDEWMLFGDMT